MAPVSVKYSFHLFDIETSGNWEFCIASIALLFKRKNIQLQGSRAITAFVWPLSCYCTCWACIAFNAWMNVNKVSSTKLGLLLELKFCPWCIWTSSFELLCFQTLVVHSWPCTPSEKCVVHQLFIKKLSCLRWVILVIISISFPSWKNEGFYSQIPFSIFVGRISSSSYHQYWSLFLELSRKQWTSLFYEILRWWQWRWRFVK